MRVASNARALLRAGSTRTSRSSTSAAAASEVIAVATHPILSDPACDRLNKSNITEIVTTNSIPLRAKTQAELSNIKVLSVANLLAEAVQRIHKEESVSSLFN